MDTNQTPTPTLIPPPGADRDESPSRLRVLAMSAAIAGLTTAGGLAVVFSGSAGGVAATNGATGTTGAVNGGTITLEPLATATASAATAQPPAQPPSRGAGPGHASSGGS